MKLRHITNNQQVYLGLGSNLEPRRETLLKAIKALQQIAGLRLVQESPIFETDPVGGPKGQPPYLNAVSQWCCDLTAHEMLDHMQTVEQQLGRVRLEKWGPRTIDLDMLFFGSWVIQDERLTVPHPLLHDRLFVLTPLAAIASEVKHPLYNLTAATLYQHCLKRCPCQTIRRVL